MGVHTTAEVEPEGGGQAFWNLACARMSIYIVVYLCSLGKLLVRARCPAGFGDSSKWPAPACVHVRMRELSGRVGPAPGPSQSGNVTNSRSLHYHGRDDRIELGDRSEKSEHPTQAKSDLSGALKGRLMVGKSNGGPPAPIVDFDLLIVH